MTTRTLTAAEIADLGLPGLPRRAQHITRRADREGWRYETTSTAGRPARAYVVDDLPEAARLELARLDAERADAGRAKGRAARLADRVTDDVAQRAAEASQAAAAALTGAARVRMEARLWVLDAWGRFEATSSVARGKAQAAFVALYGTGGIEAPPAVRAEIGVLSVRSLARWEKQRQTEGAAALAGRYGAASARTYGTAIDSDPEIRDLVVGMLYEHPRVTNKQVRRAIVADFGQARAPHLRTISRWLEEWRGKNRQLAAYLESPDGWRSMFGAAAGNKSEGVSAPNEIWELDGTLTDVELVGEDGEVRRFALCAGIDVYTRRARLHLSRTNGARSIAALMRRMILEFGLPDAVRTDEGADYTSLHVRSFLSDLKVRHLECPPYTPEAKPFVERFFGTFCRDVVELLPGFVGHSVAQRKGIEARRSMAQRHAHQGEARLKGRMSAEDFQAFCDAWCTQVYEQEAHSGIRETPLARAAAWVATGLPVRRVGNERALDVLLSAPAKGGGIRTVLKKGLSVDGIQYVHPALGEVVGQRVRVLLDETDIGRIYVFEEAGPYVCTAQNPEMAGSGVDRAAVAREMRHTQKRFIRDAVAQAKKQASASGAAGAAGRIMAAAETRAGNVVPMPAPSEMVETPALVASAAAADHGRRPARPEPEEVSDDVRAAADQLEAEAAARRVAEGDLPFGDIGRAEPTVHRLAMARPVFFDDHARYLWLEGELTAGRRISPDESAFLDRYLSHLGGEDEPRRTGSL